MGVNSKQMELAQTVPAIIGLLPSSRQDMVLKAGREAAAVIGHSALTIREQQAALAIAELFLQFCHEDPNNQKWSELIETAIRQEGEMQQGY